MPGGQWWPNSAEMPSATSFLSVVGGSMLFHTYEGLPCESTAWKSIRQIPSLADERECFTASTGRLRISAISEQVKCRVSRSTITTRSTGAQSSNAFIKTAELRPEREFGSEALRPDTAASGFECARNPARSLPVDMTAPMRDERNRSMVETCFRALNARYVASSAISSASFELPATAKESR